MFLKTAAAMHQRIARRSPVAETVVPHQFRYQGDEVARALASRPATEHVQRLSGRCTYQLTPRPDRGPSQQWLKTPRARSLLEEPAPYDVSSSPDQGPIRRCWRVVARRSSRPATGHGVRAREIWRDLFHTADPPRLRLRPPPPGPPTQLLLHPIADGAWRVPHPPPAQIPFARTDSQKPDGRHRWPVEPRTARHRRSSVDCAHSFPYCLWKHAGLRHHPRMTPRPRASYSNRRPVW